MNDEDAVVEDEDPVFEGPIVNKNPTVVSNSLYAISTFLESYGWFVLLAAIVLWYLKGLLEKKLERWQRQREDAEAHKTDSAEALKMQERILAARARLQEKYDSQNAQFLEEQKRKEEELRKQKLEDWESFLRGGTSKESRERAQALGGSGMGPSGGGSRYRPAPRVVGPR